MLKSHTENASNHCRHFFSKDGELVYPNNVEGLLQGLGSTYNPEEWRLCVHWSKYSFKVVQQHNGNINPSIPFAHSVHIKDSYENMDLLLKAKSYSKYGWNICADLQVTGLILGMLSGYKKSYAVFLVNGAAEQKTNITKLMTVQYKKTQFQGKSVSEINC